MRKASFEKVETPILVDTKTLCGILSCGRPTAIKIGTQAAARCDFGRRVLWDRQKIQQYINEIGS